ncbi:hypothetical protein K2173_025734 [Erythroxylum novogranatense]|uniref:Cyclin-dependent kinase inhibitor domain-containing protein n=1 Tax=Erythroxylum novogranatense TaxID=1862640 RepID=A0AAV8SBW0_9ROSI|nr:hypothetical protein K2173_025734 [Erythroxylum novogranatense]
MGKYMKKSKISGDIAVMEVSQSTNLGVRTRAKTLALQRLQSSSSLASPNPDTSSFLQLRSRRLEKPQQGHDTKVMQQPQVKDPKQRESSVKLGSDCGKKVERKGCVGEKWAAFGSKCETDELGLEGSFGDNCLDDEARERSTRESTPSSLIRDSHTIRTPGSATKPTSSRAANQRGRNETRRNIPTTYEIEEFFACAQQQQRRLFIEKYNFDILNDVPLPGRFEWQEIP